VIDQADPVVRRNHITKNGYEGIWVKSGAKGTYEANDLRGNARGPWDVEAGAEIKRSGNIEK
jgi:parallel beta-helix repeat protein